MIVQHGSRASFGERSCVRVSSYNIYFPNLLSLGVSPKEADCNRLTVSLRPFTCGYGVHGFVSLHVGRERHVREAVRVHDIYSGPNL